MRQSLRFTTISGMFGTGFCLLAWDRYSWLHLIYALVLGGSFGVGGGAVTHLLFARLRMQETKPPR